MARQHSYLGPNLAANANTIVIASFPSENGQKLTGSIFADQVATVHIEQSADGTNWDIDDQITLVASTGAKVDVDIILAFARVRIVNGGTAQGAIRVYLRTLSPGGM